MARVIIDMTISLDGYVAGPEDGAAFPLGKHGGRSIFDWYTLGICRQERFESQHLELGGWQRRAGEEGRQDWSPARMRASEADGAGT